MHDMRLPDATLQTSTGQGCWERRNKSRGATGPTVSEWAEALARLPMCTRHSDAARRVASTSCAASDLGSQANPGAWHSQRG